MIELEDDLLLKHQNKHSKKRHPREVSFIIDTNTKVTGKYLLFGGEEEQRGKRRKGKYLHRKGEEQGRKGGKYLASGGEEEGKGKGGKYSEKEKVMTVKQIDKQHFLL